MTQSFLPLILPLIDHRNSTPAPMPNAHRLLFVGAFTVYYSYQHPIAFYANDKLFCRQNFWYNRRRGRAEHCEAILFDVKYGPDTAMMDPREEMPDDAFFRQLKTELARCGVGFYGDGTVRATKTDARRRRITL